MKRIAVIALAALVCIGLAACGGKPAAEESPAAQETASAAAEKSPKAEESTAAEDDGLETLIGRWEETDESINYWIKELRRDVELLGMPDKEMIKFNEDGTCEFSEPGEEAEIMKYKYEDGIVTITKTYDEGEYDVKYELLGEKLFNIDENLVEYEKIG